MKKLIVFFFLLCLHNLCVSQPQQTARFEKEDKNSDEVFTIINLYESGLGLYRETNDYESGKRKHQLILLDTLLNQQIDTTFFIDKTYSSAGHDFDNNHIYLLFQESDYSNNKLKLASYHYKTKNFTYYELKTEINLKLTHFGVLNNHVFLGGYINKEPTIVLCNLNNNTTQVLPGFAIKNTELLDVRENVNGTFNVVIKEKLNLNTAALYLKTYDSTGNILLNERLPIPEGKNILTAITSKLERDDLLISGTWTKKSNTKAYGVFSVLVTPGEETIPNFWQLGELNQYLNYLKPKRVDKIKTKTKQGIENNNIYDYANGLMPYKIFETQNGFILLAETYSDIRYHNMNPNDFNNPYYQSMTNPYYYNPYFNSYPTSRLYQPYLFGNNVNNAQEIKPLSSSIILFSEAGKLNNDFSMKVEEIKIPSLRQVTDGMITKDSVSFIYKHENKIFEKKINIQNLEAKQTESEVKLKDQFDEHRYENNSDTGIQAWYGKNYFVWGYQTVRNKVTPQNEKVREVFYINKISTR